MEHNNLPLVFMLLLLLVVSRIAGEIMERLGQMAVMGEILAGIVLGPSLLGLIQPGPELKVLSDLGVFLLVMLAGMELDFGDIRDAFRGRGSWIAVAGFFFPFAAGLLAAPLIGLDWSRAVFLGLSIAITALPVSVRILLELGYLQTDLGQRIIAAAVFNDIASLVILGAILSVKADGGLLRPLLLTAAKLAVFLAAVFAANRLLRFSKGRIPHSRRAVHWLDENLRSQEPLFAVTLVFVLSFASLSDIMGLHFVVGAFFGAMVLSHRVLGRARFEDVRKTASGVAMGFLAPVFFAAIGVEFQPKALTNAAMVLIVLGVAFGGKVFGGYLGGRLAGLNPADSWVVGFGLNGRGVMELVIADLALSSGLIDEAVFSTLVLMGIVTTMLTPPLLKRAWARTASGEPVLAGASEDRAA